MAIVALIAVVLVLAGLLATAGVLVVTGALTLDTGVGRRTRPLGPLHVSIAAPREAVFDSLALAYLSTSPPRALREKVVVLERTADMVLAAHRTKVGPLTATTVETVAFERPGSIAFRLVRGPVPHVVERFELTEHDGITELAYTGELGADFWILGRVWAALVSRSWLSAVSKSLAAVQESTELGANRAAGRAAARATSDA